MATQKIEYRNGGKMFFEEIARNLGLDIGPGGYSIQNISGRCVYIQGHVNIRTTSMVKIVVMLAKDLYEITGENLQIVTLSQDTLTIKGKIFGIIRKAENT